MMCINEVPFSTSIVKVKYWISIVACSLINKSFFSILGVFNKSIFFRLDRICEDCYSLFREVELHSLCKWVSCSNHSSNSLSDLYRVPDRKRALSCVLHHAKNIRLSKFISCEARDFNSICISWSTAIPIEHLFPPSRLDSRVHYFNFLSNAILKSLFLPSFHIFFEKGRFPKPLTHEICYFFRLTVPTFERI